VAWGAARFGESPAMRGAPALQLLGQAHLLTPALTREAEFADQLTDAKPAQVEQVVRNLQSGGFDHLAGVLDFEHTRLCLQHIHSDELIDEELAARMLRIRLLVQESPQGNPFRKRLHRKPPGEQPKLARAHHPVVHLDALRAELRELLLPRHRLRGKVRDGHRPPHRGSTLPPIPFVRVHTDELAHPLMAAAPSRHCTGMLKSIICRAARQIVG